MDFQTFQREVEAAGLKAIDKGHGHWQIKGGAVLVNFYPWAKTPCVYVAGTVGHQWVSAYDDADLTAKVIAFAREPEATTRRDGTRDRRKKNYRAIKRQMLAKSRKCHWCPTMLTPETATLDHLVPLSRGGLDNPNNFVLACEPCNKGRGNDMPKAAIEIDLSDDQ